MITRLKPIAATAAVLLTASYIVYGFVGCSTTHAEITSELVNHMWMPVSHQVCEGWERLSVGAGIR